MRDSLHKVGFDDVFQAPITDAQIKCQILPSLRQRDDGFLKVSITSNTWKSIKALGRQKTVNLNMKGKSKLQKMK
jgi:hypothetical protein